MLTMAVVKLVRRFIVLFESSFKRNYIHVRDISKVFRHSLDNYNLMKDNIYNVGLSKANISKLELCEIIKKYVEDFVYIDEPIGKDPDQRNYIVSNDKIEKTGFMPDVSIDTGIKELIKGFAMLRNNYYGNV